MRHTWIRSDMKSQATYPLQYVMMSSWLTLLLPPPKGSRSSPQ